MARTYSLGRKQLIHGYRGIGKVIEHGKKHVGACGILYAMRGAFGTRVAIVAGKRIGKAAERNRAKRLLREAVRLNRPRIAEGLEIVIVARNAAACNTLHCIELDIMKLLKEAGCLCT